MMITSTTSQDYPMFEYSTSQIHPSPFIMMERSSPIKWKPKNNIEIAPNCPRCASSNTKFCYYNNYSLSQPRYFCKACRRYWTKGGSLRNVPVGGGCRKTRRTRTAKPDGGPSYLGSTTLRSECIGPANSFSKYLERNVGNDDSSPGASIGSSYGRKTDMGSFVDGADDHRLQSQVDDQFVYGHEDLACQNYNSFEMEGLFGGEFAGDHMLWAEGMNLPGFGDQESAALQNMQDFEMFSSDDQISVSGNLATTDNWSPFDPSGYEIFTRN